MEEQKLSFQEEDDFCEPGCESPNMDCIYDVNIGDDGEDSTDEDSGDGENDDESCDSMKESPLEEMKTQVPTLGEIHFLVKGVK